MFQIDWLKTLEGVDYTIFFKGATNGQWWSGGAMALGKLPVPGRPTIRMKVGQGPIALAVGAGGGLFGHFYSPLSFLSSPPPSIGDGPI